MGEFHKQIKLNITWLSSVGCKTPVYLYDSVTKTILRLPFHLRKEFYKYTKDASLTDGTLNLIMFGSWLERQLKVYFNPLVEVVATHGTPNAKRTSNNRHISNFLQKQIHETKKEAKEQNDKSNEKDEQVNPIPRRSIKCWLCHKSHRLINGFFQIFKEVCRRTKRIC